MIFELAWHYASQIHTHLHRKAAPPFFYVFLLPPLQTNCLIPSSPLSFLILLYKHQVCCIWLCLPHTYPTLSSALSKFHVARGSNFLHLGVLGVGYNKYAFFILPFILNNCLFFPLLFLFGTAYSVLAATC